MNTYILQTPDGDFIVQTNRGDLLAKYMSDDIGGIQVSEEHAEELFSMYTSEDLVILMTQQPIESEQDDGNEILDNPESPTQQSGLVAIDDNRFALGGEVKA